MSFFFVCKSLVKPFCYKSLYSMYEGRIWTRPNRYEDQTGSGSTLLGRIWTRGQIGTRIRQDPDPHYWVGFGPAAK